MSDLLETIRELQYQKIRSKRRIRRIIILLVFLLLLGGVAALYYVSVQQNKNFEITEYTVNTDKIDGSVKIAVLSDLHNSEFGENNRNLIQAIENVNPDFILMCGDMVIQTDPDIGVVLNLCQELIKTADIYYLLGNHEGVLEYDEDGLQIPLDAYLYKIGVKVCYTGEYVIATDAGDIRLFSASMTQESYQADDNVQAEMDTFLKQEGYKIIVDHYPTLLYDELYDADYDLGIAGHFHGGQIIIPGIGGLFHKDTGFFPKYYGGLYDLGKAELVVTRGLGNSSLIPRINNPPELTVININGV